MNFALEPIPHDEAVALIADKPAVTRDVFDRLPAELQARAFTISGIEDFDVLQAVRDRIAELPQGANWDEVKKDVTAELSPWMNEQAALKRAELLMRHHGFAAYAAAQAREMDELIDVFPFGQYISTEDGHVRPTHAAMNGIILPAKHPFWLKHTPPWEWNCRCDVVELTDLDMEEERARDKNRPVDKRRVLEGAALEKLEKENQLVRGPGTIVDTRTPKERGGKFEINVRNLTLPYSEIQKRWDDKTRQDFETWAEGVELADRDNSLLGWLKGKFAREKTKGKSPEGSGSFQSLARDILDGKEKASTAKSLLESMSPGGREQLRREEENIRGKKEEHGRLFDKSGKLVWKKKGMVDRIPYPADVDTRGKIFTHNHPKGTSFSPEDLVALYELDLGEIRVVTQRGVFMLQRSPHKRLSQIESAMNEVGSDVAATLRSLESEYPVHRLDEAQNHLMWSIIADRNLIQYKFEPMRPDKPIPLTAEKPSGDSNKVKDEAAIHTPSLEEHAAFRRGETRFPGMDSLQSYLKKNPEK